MTPAQDELLDDCLHEAADLTREADTLAGYVRNAESVESLDDMLSCLAEAEEAAQDLLKQLRKLRDSALIGAKKARAGR